MKSSFFLTQCSLSKILGVGVMVVAGNLMIHSSCYGLKTDESENRQPFTPEIPQEFWPTLHENSDPQIDVRGETLNIEDNNLTLPFQETDIPANIAQGENPQLIPLEKIEVVGSSVFTPSDFAPIITPLEGKSVTEQELQNTVNAITQLYLNGGYLNSRATLVGIENGIAKIVILEGSVSKVIVEGTDRLQNYVRSRVQLGLGTPLNVRKLEQQLRLLQNDPLFVKVSATLKPPEAQEESNPEKPSSILVVKVEEANPFYGNTSLDNYSPPSIGATRFSLNLGYRNLIGIGDQLSASYRPRLEAWTDTYRLEFNYRAPLNPMNGSLNFNALLERNKIISGDDEALSNISELNIRGDSERYTLDYRQPIILKPSEELALSVGFSYYNGQTFLFNDIGTPLSIGPNPEGISTTSVFTFGQEYILRQKSGAWGVRSQFRFGTGLFDATSNPSPIPSGQFFSWLGQVQRLQLINPSNFLIIQLDVQLTPDPLLPSEQFVIGGGDSVRGYRQNVLAGDNGVRFSIEDRIILVRNEAENPVFTLAPFFDLGAVWNAPDNPNTIFANQTLIAGLGLGFIWQPIEKMSIRIDYAPPLIDLNTRGDNIQDDGLYFSINYDF